MGRWRDARGRWGGRALNDNHCDENDDDDVDGGSDGPWEGGKLPGVGPGGRVVRLSTSLRLSRNADSQRIKIGEAVSDAI